MYNSVGLDANTISTLTDMLDPTNATSKAAFKRPTSQTVGYSLAETQSSEMDANAAATGAQDSKHSVAATPGAVALPTALDKSLPAPSGSNAARAMAAKAVVKPKGNAIWDDSEVDQHYGSTVGKAEDKREAPEYEVLYKQSASVEDVYLGADYTRDGSIAGSEALLVKVMLPKMESSKEIELDVDVYAMHLRTKDYKLRVDLPAKVIEKKGAAKWDNVKKVLAVTLTVDQSGKEVLLMN
jgi:hypothetical protein